MIRLRDEAAFTSPPPSQLPSASRKEDRSEVTLPTRKRLDIAFGPRYEVGESSSAAAARPAGGFRADYGFVAAGAPVSVDTELGGYVREFETRVRQDMDEIYTRLDDEQTERQLLAGRLNMLFRDRRKISEIRELQAADRRRQTVISELLRMDHKRSQSPEYVPESDFEAHPEDDDDEDPEEDPVDYLADGGDDGDDEEESSKDDEDDDIDIKADEKEEEEHPAPADSVVVASTAADQAPSVEETEPFETDESAATPPPHPAYRMTARISIPAPLPSASRGEDRPEVTLPPQKRLGIALGPRYKVGESSSVAAARPAGGLRADYGFVATMDREIMRDLEREVGYGITDSWDEIVETLQEAPVSTDTELGGYMREDRRAHAYTRHLMETEARMSRKAWVRATDASDLVHGKVMSLRTTVLGTCDSPTGTGDSFAGTGYHITGTAGTCWGSCIARATRGGWWQFHAMLSGVRMAMIAIIPEQVLEGQNELLVNVLTPNFLSVNHYLSKAPKELPVFPNGRAGTDLDANVVTGTFLLNNQYASILFDTGADISFVSTTFSTQINITPLTLDHCYDVELADGRIIRLNTILRGCTLNLLNHPFNIDLMPVELGSFDVIIDMDWLAKYQAVIDEKEYEEHLKAILELLKKEELYAKFSKCEFWIPKVQFLGHVIDSQGIYVDPTKIESVKD
nr:reverse transcriptase domain-containing protein [Tanacetum cinerariifolium]